MRQMKKTINIRNLAIIIPALILVSTPTMAAQIFGPAQINATTPMLDSGEGFTVDQICDGIIDPPVWFNGFAATPGLVGTIRLDLATAADLYDFVLWNDINVLAEGIADFRLDFFDSANLPLGSTEIFTGPLGFQAPVVYDFEPVTNVKRVDLVVLTLNVNQRLEIREVGFNSGDATSAVDDVKLPGVTRLQGAFPNPFNPQTTIAFELAGTGPVHLTIYGLDGRRVIDLVDEERPAGAHVVSWQGRDDAGRQVASGTYLMRLQTQDGAFNSRLTLVK